MIEKQFHFMAGMPRSGSTLLISILNQNPSLYGTPTSPLLDLLFLNEMAWRQCPSVIANPMPEQLVGISEAIINGCWQHIPQNIIIDKHRAWGKNLGAIQHIFKKKPKVIVTVRDVPSVISSFMRLLRESDTKPTYIDRILLDRQLSLTDENRADVLWNDFIKDPWISFKMAWEYDKSSLLLVDYDRLMIDKQQVMKEIYQFLELPEFIHDFDNIQNETVDDDLLAWSLEGLHTIRPKLEKTAKSPKEILGEKIYNKYYSANLEFWK